jgi:alanine dehydrogenase
VDKLTLGVVATSAKEHERRLPIHPQHLSRIESDLRQRTFLEWGYGRSYGIADEELEPLVGGMRERAQLFAECDVILLPKPQHADVAAMRPGQVLWGWPHCVQDAGLTQLGIDRRLTMIAWEAMNHYTSGGAFSLHVFHKNNELAGYCSVMHALQLRGVTGHFGPQLEAAVISFGATARGAVSALLALGVSNVTVLTHRSVPAVAAPMPPSRLVHYDLDDATPRPHLAHPERGSLAELLGRHDIVVNCVLQDTDRR